MALSKTTQDHDEIRQWAEARGGKPAEVTSTGKPGAPGILRFEFPNATNANDANLNEIPWEEFFEKFDASGLSLVYQEVTSEGAESNFNRLVYPDNVSPSTRKGTGKKAASAKKGAKAAPAKASGTKAAPNKSTAKSPAKAATPPAKTAKTTAKKTAAAEPVKKSAADTTSAQSAKTSSPTAKKTAGTKAAAPAKTAAKKTTKAGAQQAAVAIKKTAAKKASPAKKGSR